MAITAAQRSTALTYVLAAAVSAGGATSPAPLSTLLPGVQPTDVLNALLNALGTSVDSTLTTALANAVTTLQAELAATNAQATSIQNQITADTVV